jgi:hypothetical protein
VTAAAAAALRDSPSSSALAAIRDHLYLRLLQCYLSLSSLSAAGAGHGGVVNLLGAMIPKAGSSAAAGASSAASSAAAAHHEEPKVRLLDDKRFMHMSIMLKKLPALDTVIKAIRVLDSHQTIDQVSTRTRTHSSSCERPIIFTILPTTSRFLRDNIRLPSFLCLHFQQVSHTHPEFFHPRACVSLCFIMFQFLRNRSTR